MRIGFWFFVADSPPEGEEFGEVRSLHKKLDSPVKFYH